MTKQARNASGLGRFGDPGVLVLMSLAAGPRHGHAMTLDIEDQTGVRLGPGTLYGSITKLNKMGLIVALPSDDRRCPYEITDAGRSALREALAMWGSVVQASTQRLATT